MPRRWDVPEGLRVLSNGSWKVGELPVVHGPSLDYFKRHLVFEDDGAFVVDGAQRMPISVEGPAFTVVSLAFDAERSEIRAVLDDGTSELLSADSLGMDEETGRFRCAVRGGRARALLSRQAHQALLDHVEEEAGRFYVRAGSARLTIRT